jgi:hypothetical protein
MNQKIYLVSGLLMILLSGSCRKPDKSWDINALVPLAHGDLTIENMVKDSTIKKNADNTLSLVNVETLKSLDISSLLKIPDTTFKKTVSLQTIDLGTRIITRNITLGEVAKNAGLAGLIIVSNNGKKMIVPPLTGLATGPTDINAQSLFTTATFVDGNLELTIRNGFPIALTDIHFQLLNKSNPNPAVVDDTIAMIPAGAVHTKTYTLAGKTVNGLLTANILNMNSPGSNGDSVLVDTTNAIGITIKGYNMHVFSATAIFPAQNVVNDMLDIHYSLSGPEFKSFIIRSGFIHFVTRSTIKDSMHVFYTIPGAVKGGKPLVIIITIPPYSGTGADSTSQNVPLDGYNVDLTGQHKDTSNTYYNILQVHIDSTGKLESLALTDSVYIFYGLFKVIPEYAKGFLGTKTYEIGPEYANFDLFKNVSVNSISFPEMKVNLQISNGIGAPGTGTINSIVAFNSKTNKSLTLTSSWLNKPITVPAATDNPVLTPAVVNIPLDNTNSNINKLLEILPDKIFYDITFTMNPNGNTNNYNDFIYYESKVSANLNIELPLHVGFDGLVLQDTITPDFNSAQITDNVQEGTLHLTLTNDYPVQAKVQLYIEDFNNKIIDSLINTTSNTIPAGNGDPLKPIPGKGTINVNISESQWQKIKQKNRLIIKTTLKTSGSQPVKIYSNSHIKATLTGDFRYRVISK